MILARNIISKNIRTLIMFVRKINKFPNFTRFFALKRPEFYITIARKIFFPIFRGWGWRGHVPPALPVFYAYVFIAVSYPRMILKNRQ